MRTIRQLILESRESDFRTAAASILSPTDIEYAIENDPSGNGKFFSWIIKMAKQTDGFSMRAVMDLLTKFVAKVKGKDINQIKSLEDLRSIVDQTKVGRKKEALSGADILVDDEDWLVAKPDTHDACQNLGGSTRWCIATSNDYFWNDHYMENTIVIVKNRNLESNDRMWKVAIVGQGDSGELYWDYYDTNDRQLGRDQRREYWESLPEHVQEAIKEAFESDDVYGRRDEYFQKKLDRAWKDSGMRDMEDYIFKLFGPENEYFGVDREQVQTLMSAAVGGEEKYKELLQSIWYYRAMENGEESVYWSDADRFLRTVRDSDNYGEHKNFTEALKFMADLNNTAESICHIVNGELDRNMWDEFWKEQVGDYGAIITQDLLDYQTKHKDFVQQDVSQMKLPGMEDESPTTIPKFPSIQSIGDVLKFYQSIGKPEVVQFLRTNRLTECVNFKDLMESMSSYSRYIPSELKSLVPKIVDAAQSVYDSWDQNDDGDDVELGSGGICQDIASAIADVVNQSGKYEAATVEAQIGDQHVWTIAREVDSEEHPATIWDIDISPYTYETGGGYTWKKIKGVKFDSDDISISRNSDAEWPDQY